MNLETVTHILQDVIESPTKVSPADVVAKVRDEATKNKSQMLNGAHLAFIEFICKASGKDPAELGMSIDIAGIIGTPRYNDYLIGKWFLTRDIKVMQEMKLQFSCAVVGVPDSMLWASASLCKQYPHFNAAWESLPKTQLEIAFDAMNKDPEGSNQNRKRN